MQDLGDAFFLAMGSKERNSHLYGKENCRKRGACLQIEMDTYRINKATSSFGSGQQHVMVVHLLMQETVSIRASKTSTC